MVYELKEFDLPESFQNKPRWVHCITVATAVFFITISTVAVGALLGYTYCYIEHRNTLGGNTGNVTHSTNLQIIHMPYPDTAEAQYNRTINGAISGVMSSLMMSRILNIGQAVMDNDLNCIPLSGGDRSSDIL